MKSPWTRIVAALLGGLALGGCNPPAPAADNGGSLPVPGVRGGGGCLPGHAGCPCSAEGQVIACGSQVSQSGNYVTCSLGTAVCQGGRWGACTQNKLVTKSLGGATLGATGLHMLSVTQPCDDKCDPNACTLTTSNANDVDASLTINAGDGGLTLVPPAQDGGCAGTQCQLAFECSAGSPTTITGVVHDPAGVNPVYNALVYVPLSPALPPLPQGASCDACLSAQQVQAVVVTRTAADGSFSLPFAPSTDVGPGAPIPLVVQLGKWRREVLLQAVPKCQVTTTGPDDARLPKNGQDGNNNQADLPRIAIATGAHDPFECVLLKMGIDPNEFENPTAADGGHVDFFRNNGLDLAPGAPADTELYGGDAGVMQPYDAVILPCPGPNPLGGLYGDTLASYVNSGGHAFLTHFSDSWLTQPTATQPTNPFASVASWNDGGVPPAGSIDTTIDTTQPNGQALSSWLADIDASTDAGHLSVSSARTDVSAVNAPAQQWIYATASNEPIGFSFDTPLGATAPPADAGPDAGGGACGRVVFSDFHVSTADLATSNTCTKNSDCGFTATCGLTAGTGTGTCKPVACGVDAQCPTGYTCVGSVAGACVETQACDPANEVNDCFSHVCQADLTCLPTTLCHADFECGNVETCSNHNGACVKSCVNSDQCTAGEICVSGQCTGCNNNTFCPSGTCNAPPPVSTCSPSSSTLFPEACLQGRLTPQEDALEFMFLDLTSCDTAPPPPLAQAFTPVTFTEDFVSSCPTGTRVIWRELDWQATIPSSASITFSAQTANAPADGGAVDWTDTTDIPIVPVFVDDVGTVLPGTNAALLDTGSTGVFNTFMHMPPVQSGDHLRLTVTLSPTSDDQAAPTLLDWSIKADCVASE